MPIRRVAHALFGALLFCLLHLSGVVSSAQVCPTTAVSGKMICVIPQLYGPAGLILPNPRHAAHFQSSFQQSFTPLNAALGQELSILPLASPASGITFVFDRSLGVVTRSTESFGPILSERAETIGRRRFYIAATYQYFGFSTLDGIDLKRLPADFKHLQFPIGGVIPLFEQDYITTSNRIDLKLHQVTFFATYGLTDRVDVSVAVPILDVHMGVTSQAHIVRIAPPNPADPSAVQGEYHFFNINDPVGSTDATFFTRRSAAGLGDVVFRVKGTAIKRERFRVAGGVDVRVPSGDEQNFLGSGAAGVKPFVVVSYRARISPHANIGYEWNGSSILAGNISTGAKARLPNQFFYSGGVDIGVAKRLTLATDLLGQRVIHGFRVQEVPFVDTTGVSHPDIPNISNYTDSFNLDDLALGFKYEPFGKLLLTGNILIKLDDGGLRARVVPLVGLSYTF